MSSVLIKISFNYKINLNEQESDEVDPRLSSIRDTSFSWESIDSQAGSRQSLLDNKGRCRLLNVSQSKLGAIQVRTDCWLFLPRSDQTVLQGSWPVASQPVWRGNAGGETQDMADLTRRQREQRKKDIREKVRWRLSYLPSTPPPLIALLKGNCPIQNVWTLLVVLYISVLQSKDQIHPNINCKDENRNFWTLLEGKKVGGSV